MQNKITRITASANHSCHHKEEKFKMEAWSDIIITIEEQKFHDYKNARSVIKQLRKVGLVGKIKKVDYD